MRLYPAIDILGGSAVRLRQGSYEQSTVYSDSPLNAALSWVDAGASVLHIVDLDGARSGAPVNLDLVREIAAAVEAHRAAGVTTPALCFLIGPGEPADRARLQREAMERLAP